MTQTKRNFRGNIFENNQDYTIKWSILKYAIPYTGGSKRCTLCLEEKFCILKDINKDNLLNKRSEIFGKCRHKTDFEYTRSLTKFNDPSIISPISTVSPISINCFAYTHSAHSFDIIKATYIFEIIVT